MPLSRFYLSVIPLCTLLLMAGGCIEKPQPANNNPASLPVIKTPANRDPGLDKSPMDMIYYPVDFPISKMSSSGDKLPLARVIYSRPRKEGRTIFGGMVKYGEPWRLGANEATEIEFFTDVKIQRKRVNKGRYIVYAIPQPDHWQLRLNTNLYTWGLNIDSSFDAYSFQVPVDQSSKALELFSMEFSPTTDSTKLVIGWDTLRVSLPITFNQ